LADKKRLNLLPAIVGLYEDYVADHKKTMDVKVVSAYPIDEARVNRLRLALQENLKRQVTLQCSVDRSLLGGAIIYAGDQVIDGSLRSKLKKLADRLSS
jgi:F-type H+-transporting ATPase subunit delta